MPYGEKGATMPRKARDERLVTRTARLKLSPRREPYWRNIQEGRAIGYRRVAGGKAGSWIARHYDGTAGKRLYQALGAADDMSVADGADTLTFTQAQEAARGWFSDLARQGGKVVEPITIRQALDAYLADYTGRGGKDERRARNIVAAHILPVLGERDVASLTSPMIRTWHRKLASAPARLRTRAGAKTQNVRETDGDDAQRARRATANRVLTILKAALNLAFRDGAAPSDDAWRRVKPFGKVDAPRIRYLTDAEALRLVNACNEDFRRIVTAALLTGARYGELCRLRAVDFDERAGLIKIAAGKTGKGRTVPLTNDGRTFFRTLAAGKGRTVSLLTRGDGEPWGESHQHRPIQEACTIAKIEPAIGFHILRHTAASRLVNRGVPMSVIAKLLGNSEGISAKHYAHVADDYADKMIRGAGSAPGIVPETNVASLDRRVA